MTSLVRTISLLSKVKHQMMPIYMDRHIVPGIEAKHAAEAHREDLKIQEDYGCRCMTYWVDEERGYAFCLIDAPDINAVHEMHERAHGLIPHEIIQVNSHVIEAFMGRMEDPIGRNDPEDPTLKVFNDPAFRAVLVTKTTDPVLLQHRMGKEKSDDLFIVHDDIIREQLLKFEGREVELEGLGFIASFVSVSQAVKCAQAIQKALHIAGELLGFRIGIHAGIPVTKKHQDLFGETIHLAKSLCAIGLSNQVLISSVIQKLYKPDNSNTDHSKIRSVNIQEEDFLISIYNTLDKNWFDPNFGVPDFCQKMSMSKSSLYRTCMSLIGTSPNQILRDFRLENSLDLLKSGENISQTTFSSGFSSPSYFSKCFQEKFLLQPLAYQKLALAS